MVYPNYWENFSFAKLHPEKHAGKEPLQIRISTAHLSLDKNDILNWHCKLDDNGAQAPPQITFEDPQNTWAETDAEQEK